jgi:hypothetical protein
MSDQTHLLSNTETLPKQVTKASPYFTRPDYVDEPLYVIFVSFNPERSRNLMRYPVDAAKYWLAAGAIVYQGEVSLGQRNQVFTETITDKHVIIHIETTSQLWLKENMQNIVSSKLPNDAKYIAMVDPDVFFFRPDIVGETIQKLQQYDVVQMFSKAWDINKDYEAFGLSYGFVHDWSQNLPLKYFNGSYYVTSPSGKFNRLHTGYAWAYRRKALDDLGGLFDVGILGSGDNHMAKCLIGEWEKSVNMGVTQDYKDELIIWQDRALKYIKKNIGYVKGDLYHRWHGAKEMRFYKTRWQVLVNNKYSPRTDIKKDINGLWQLVTEDARQINLKKEIREYFQSRDDDGTGREPKAFWLTY